MSRPVLFLDIDGVLNGHEYDERAQSSSLRQDCVERLNRVIGETDCVLVVSSAWRYMILRGAMTLTGFGYLLRTHGVHCAGRLAGLTGEDSQIEDLGERREQILGWLADHPDVHRYAVVDDLALALDSSEWPQFVKTDGSVGLTDTDAARLVELLRG